MNVLASSFFKMGLLLRNVFLDPFLHNERLATAFPLENSEIGTRGVLRLTGKIKKTSEGFSVSSCQVHDAVLEASLCE